jgi:hypothetical protein
MFLMTGEMQTLHPKGTANVNTTPRWVWGTTDYDARFAPPGSSESKLIVLFSVGSGRKTSQISLSKD